MNIFCLYAFFDSTQFLALRVTGANPQSYFEFERPNNAATLSRVRLNSASTYQNLSSPTLNHP